MCANFRFSPLINQLPFLYILFIITNSMALETSEEDETPKGIYHYSNTDRNIESSFRIPDFEALDPIRLASDLMSSAMKVDTKRKTLAGFDLPFSLTGRPMSLQINGESHDAVSLVDPNKEISDKQKAKLAETRRSDMSPESRRAFLRARQICLAQSSESCDEALDTFHRIRYGTSLLDSEDEVVDQNYRTMIERKVKEIEETTTKPHRTDHLSYATLPQYHDKAQDFLREIN